MSVKGCRLRRASSSRMAPCGGCLVCEVRGRRVASEEPGIRRVGPVGFPAWLADSCLGERASDDRRPWVVGQPALGLPSRLRPGARPWRFAFRLAAEPALGPSSCPRKKDLWVIVVFSIIDGVLLLATPIAVEALVNTVAFGRYLQPIVVLAIMLFTFLTFAAALRGLLSYVVEILQRRLFVRSGSGPGVSLATRSRRGFRRCACSRIGQSFLRDRDRPEGRQLAAAGRGLDHPADLCGHGGAGLLPSVPAGL